MEAIVIRDNETKQELVITRLPILNPSWYSVYETGGMPEAVKPRSIGKRIRTWMRERTLEK